MGRTKYPPDDGSNNTWASDSFYFIHKEVTELDSNVENSIKKAKEKIEPWLTALFESESLSLLLGTGISTAVGKLTNPANSKNPMGEIDFSVFNNQIKNAAKESAENAKRGEPNIEDIIRVTNDLIRGLDIYTCDSTISTNVNKDDLDKLKNELNNCIKDFVNNILKNEKDSIFGNEDNTETKANEVAAEYLINFLISFATRAASRERLNVFTTNYDRIIEYGCELAGIRLIDRFVGIINPVFRSSRANVDMHYNPPGIRGEPRYLEGVAHFTKLHGSLDWIMNDRVVRRIAVPYGTEDISKFTSQFNSLMIYPNSSKERETAEYPYVELFRDFAASICRPNSTVVVYGYSFGDEHINRVLIDMLTIPSTHIVIISYNDENKRIEHFFHEAKRPSQITLLIGNYLGDLKNLVDHCLPKPAMDIKFIKMVNLLRERDLIKAPDNGGKIE